MPSPTSLHIDSALSNVAVLYRNEEFIGNKIFPFLMTNGKRSDKFNKFKKGERFRQVSTLMGPKSRANELSYNLDTPGNYSVVDHGLEDFVAYADVANADAPLDPYVDSTEILTNALLLDYEMEIASLAFTSGNYASANKSTPGSTADVKWNAITSTPVDQILAAIDGLVGIPGPFTCAIGNDAWTALRKHPDLLAAIQPTGKKVVASKEDVQEFFGFDELLIGKAWKNTALEGATDSYSRIWNDGMLIFRRSASPNMVRDVCLGRTFVSDPFSVVRWEDMSRGKGGEYVKPAWSYDACVVAADAGFLIYDVL